MSTVDNKKHEDHEEIEDMEEDHSFRNAMFSAIIFVGGGVVSFWILLFMIFTARG